MSDGKKVGRHDRMMAMLADSSSDDEATAAKAKVGAIKPTDNPIPTMGKKRAQQAALDKFGAGLGDDSDADSTGSFDKPVMAKAQPKPDRFKGYTPTPAAAPAAKKKAVAEPVTEKVVVAAAAPKPVAVVAAAPTPAAAAAAAVPAHPDAPPQKKALFDDDDEDDNTIAISGADADGLSKKALAAVEGTLSINRNYADRYDAVKRKQELQQLADKYKIEYDAEESDETDEEEDETADALNVKGNDAMWAEVFYKLCQKDSAITDKSVGFFKELEEKRKAKAEAGEEEEESDSSDDDESDGDGPSSGGAKRYTLKDEYQRAIMGGDAYDETAHANIEEEERHGKLKPRTAEERAAKAAFMSAIGGGGGAAADEDDEDVFVKKEGGKSSADIYGGNKEKEKGAKKEKVAAKKHTKTLADAFDTLLDGASAEEKQQEAFLKSFFMNEKWREDNDSDSEDEDNEYMGGGLNKKGMKKGDINWEQLAKEDQDDLFFDEAEQWERDFQNKQFHHEMVDGADDLQVKSFPRRATMSNQAAAAGTVGSVTISTLKSVHGAEEGTVQALGAGGDGLLRKHESTRAEQRRRKAERAAEAEAQRVEELKRLKTLKRMEIEEKRDMIARVAGFMKGGSTANTNDASLEEFNLENPFAANSTDPKDDKKKSKKNKQAAPVEGNEKLLKQLMQVWSNEELEKDFDGAEFDQKMAALFDTDEFNNDIDEEEIAKIRAEIDADDIDFGAMDGGDDDDDEGLTAEELAEKLLNEEVDVGFGEDGGDDGLFYANDDDDSDEDEDGDDGILGDDELFGGLQNVVPLEKKKKAGKKSAAAADEDGDDADQLYGSTNSTGAAGLSSGAEEADDDDLTALLYPTQVMSKMEKEAAAKAEKKAAGGLTVNASSKKKDLESYMVELQKDLDSKVDEYNKLHYDKVLSGGLKTRFRYRTVNAESFGLTDEDILTKDDRTLNMIAPMKLYAAYLGPKENKRDRQRCVSRIQNLRQLDPARRSRKYGDVSKTILFDTTVSEEEGKAMAARVRLSTKKLIASNEAEDVAVEAERDLKEVRKAKREAKKAAGSSSSAADGAAPKRAREDDGKGESGAPSAHRKPFEGRGGFRGGNRGGGGSSFAPRGGGAPFAGGNFRGGRGAGAGGNFRGGRGAGGGNGNFRGNSRGGFTPRGRGSQ